MVRAADPADTPASIRVCVLSGEVRDIKGSCLACFPVSQQKVSRAGVATIGCEVIASFHLDAKIGPVACFSQNITKEVVSYHHITATLTSGGMMSQRVKGIVKAKWTLGSLGSVHTKPPFHGNLMYRCIKM